MTSQPDYLHNLISVQSTGRTRSLSLVTLADLSPPHAEHTEQSNISIQSFLSCQPLCPKFLPNSNHGVMHLATWCLSVLYEDVRSFASLQEPKAMMFSLACRDSFLSHALTITDGVD